MKRILTILFLFISITAFSQKYSYEWIRSQDITNTRHFIWHGDTIDFAAFVDSIYVNYADSISIFATQYWVDSLGVLQKDSTVLYVTPKQLLDSLAALPGGHDPVTISTTGTTNGLSLSSQILSLRAANSSQAGAISSNDWNIFNNKLSAVSHDNSMTGTGTAANPLKVDTTRIAHKNWVLNFNYLTEEYLNYDSLTNTPTIPLIINDPYGASWETDVDNGASRAAIYDAIQSAGGSGSTNLTYSAFADSGRVNSDTGTDAVIPAGSTTNASLMLPGDKEFLDTVDDSLTVHRTDININIQGISDLLDSVAVHRTEIDNINDTLTVFRGELDANSDSITAHRSEIDTLRIDADSLRVNVDTLLNWKVDTTIADINKSNWDSYINDLILNFINISSEGVDNEVPLGSKNGSNTDFLLAYVPATNSEHIYLNGARQSPGRDYSMSGDTIRFFYAPVSTDVILVDYAFLDVKSGKIPDPVYAGDYFIDSENGSDSNTGLSPSQAWASLTPVNSATLAAGDTILFARGSEFEGTLTVSASGTSGNPIVYGAYGTGPKPKIYGSEVITGWTLHSGNIYKAEVTDEVTQVFINDERIQNARYPKDGYAYIDIVNSTTSVTCNALDAGINYAGAKMHTRTVQWRLITNTVVSSSSKTLTVDVAPSYGFAEDKAFFLNNHLDFLTAPGEWYFDSGTNTLYVWTPNSDSPANYTVRASIHENNVLMPNRSYITLKDLELKHASLSSIEANNQVGQSSSNITIDNVDVSNPNGHGIWMTRTSYSKVLNSSINGCVSMGILITNPNISDTGHILIQDNEITDIAEFKDIGASGSISDLNESVGIFTRVNNATIKYNRLENIGYIGIYPRGQNGLVQYNYVKNFCQTLNDGGGIYVWRGNNGTDPNPDITSGTIIEYNIVDNSNKIGDDGYNRTPTNSSGVSLFYADETSTNVIFRNNIAMNGGSGRAFLTNQPKSVTFENNVAFNCGEGYRYNNNATFSEDNNFIGNIINQIESTTNYFGLNPLTPSMGLSNASDAVTFDYNTYIDRYRTNVFRNTSGSFMNFTSWQTHVADEANSTFIGAALSANETETIVYNDSKVAKTFYLNNATNVANNVTGASITTSFVVQPFTAVLVKGLNVDYILDYEDSVAPVITTFALPETSSELTITPTLLTSTGDATSYILTESATTPNLYDSGWSLTPSYSFTSNGEKTLYAWARDEAGNISTSVNASIFIDVSPDLTTGLIAVYDMQDSGTTLPDETVKGLDGTHFASVTPTTGNPGSGLTYSFAVNRYTTISDNVAFDFTEDFTVAVWLNIASLSSNRALIAKSDAAAGSVNEFEIFITTDGKVQVNIHENGTTNYISASTPASTISIGNDYLIEVKMDDSDRVKTGLEISVNRISQSLTYGGTISDLTSGILHTTSNIYIGYTPRANYYCNGIISQISLFDRKISPIDSDYLYNSGSGRDYLNW